MRPFFSDGLARLVLDRCRLAAQQPPNPTRHRHDTDGRRERRVQEYDIADVRAVSGKGAE
jgi:hypothetical protein